MPVSLGQRARKIVQMLKKYGGVKQYGFERRGILVRKVFLVMLGMCNGRGLGTSVWWNDFQ